LEEGVGGYGGGEGAEVFLAVLVEGRELALGDRGRRMEGGEVGSLRRRRSVG
jgi:hypothetical protein